jgi:glutaredoxin
VDVVLFTRRGCHLCEQAEDLLACHWPAARLIDVDATPDLAVRYGLRVPVLQVNGVDVLEGRIDEVSLGAALG